MKKFVVLSLVALSASISAFADGFVNTNNGIPVMRGQLIKFDKVELHERLTQPAGPRTPIFDVIGTATINMACGGRPQSIVVSREAHGPIVDYTVLGSFPIANPAFVCHAIMLQKMSFVLDTFNELAPAQIFANGVRGN